MRLAIILLLCFVSISDVGFAILKYQQELTLYSWSSKEDIEKKVANFCSVAKDDPQIRVVDVKYKKKRGRKAPFIAIITCHVSESDRDLMRVSFKADQLELIQ